MNVNKYAIMSDVHANPVALEVALADARSLGCDKFILAGDVVGYGYDDKSVVDLVRENFDVVVSGNHEESGDFDGTLGVEEAAWLSTLPVRHYEEDFCCLHGHAYEQSGSDGVMACMPDDDAVITGTNPEVRGVRLTLCGHTHHAVIWERRPNGLLKTRFCDSTGARLLTSPESVSVGMEEGASYIVNCGSVGYPRSIPASTYAIYDCQKKRVTIRRLPFDFGRYVDGFVSRGLELPFTVLRFARMDNAV